VYWIIEDTGKFFWVSGFLQKFHSESWAILNPFLKKISSRGGSQHDQPRSSTSRRGSFFALPPIASLNGVSEDKLLANTLISIQKSRRFFAN